jgi:hypothetical protein
MAGSIPNLLGIDVLPDFKMMISYSYGCLYDMAVEVNFGHWVEYIDYISILHPFKTPLFHYISRIIKAISRDKRPIVMIVVMRIQGDLLFYRSHCQ